MNEGLLPLKGTRIGFFGKGGAGKSTVLVLMARLLARKGYDVCVLDADSTNVGLHQALQIEFSPTPLLDYFGGMVFSGGAVTCPVDDPTLLPQSEIILDDLPERYYARTPEGIVFLATGKLADKGPGAGCDGPLVKIARDLIINDGANSILLIDFKAGFEDTARGAITSLDYAIVVIDPTQAAMQMAVHMRDMVRAIIQGGLPATQHLDRLELVLIANSLYHEARIEEVFYVLNKVADETTENYIRCRLAEDGITPSAVIYEDPTIKRAWLFGEPLNVDRSPAVVDIAEFIHVFEEHVALVRAFPVGNGSIY